MKFLRDLHIVNGKLSQKRLLTSLSFIVSLIYAFIPAVITEFEVKEFVFLGFLSLSGFSIYRIQQPNQNLNQPNNEQVS